SDDVHITVEFLGDLDKEKIREVESILARVCVNYSALEFALEHFDAYPDFTNPKVLVVGIKDETGLGLALQSEIHDELDKLGLIINHNRSWQPHLTVARVKAEWDRAGHYRKLPIEQISWRVDKVILFESKLEPDGPVYFILSEYQLK
ncbi:MAG TPA: RNA 2',3'-cyclic phosphodiesterase, partial [Candidatus Methylomirabilis sp.]|nr:RNA 2',3'-cyclic phosphodiesterase [Candidatus Methylomirabilis sp.]